MGWRRLATVYAEADGEEGRGGGRIGGDAQGGSEWRVCGWVGGGWRLCVDAEADGEVGGGEEAYGFKADRGCASTPGRAAKRDGESPGRSDQSAECCCCCSGWCQYALREASSSSWFVSSILDVCLACLPSPSCRCPRHSASDSAIMAVLSASESLLSASESLLSEDGVGRGGEMGAAVDFKAGFPAELHSGDGGSGPSVMEPQADGRCPGLG